MRYLKKFSLFESIKFRDIDLKNIWDVEAYMDCLAFFENEIQKANNYEDFQRWLIAYSYKTFLLGSNYEDLRAEKEEREEEYQKKIEDPSVINPSGFNYEPDALKYPILKSMIDNIGSCLFTIGNAESFYDKSIKECAASALKKVIFSTLSNIFWPGYMKNISDLKFLDVFDDQSKRSLGIDEKITDALEYSLKEYSKMEKDRNHLANKFILLLEEIGKNNIRTFENVIFPEIMDQVVVEYFSSNDPETFKKADQIRNMNIPLFDKIKELLPNIDTAADLGDLGF